MIKEVFIIFKTHLDIGYTDYAENVVKKYLNNFIPSAIDTAYALKGTDTPFIWTVGSWLIWEGLKHDTDKKLENAIRDGIITWHGLPFTSHTELMSEKLFNYGLSLSKKLDERFGKTTIGSKMTDVPGHTIGMVPLMAKAGIKFLHLGVNTGTPNPEVPHAFKWRCDDSEVVVMYENGYGGIEEFEDFAICFGHTFDNHGAQSVDEIKKLYENLKQKYPSAKIKAATLDDVAEKMLTLKNLPIIYNEIGDTWIHGAGTDPKKLGMYRELLRYIDKINIDDKDLSDNLLLVPEHTWGMCQQKYFNNTNIWYNEDFKKTEGTKMRSDFEKSWTEQRNYVKKAEKVLDFCADYTPQIPDLCGYEKVQTPEPDFSFSWQLFSTSDYKRYMEKYLTLTPENVGWVIWDYLKLGLPTYDGGIFEAKVTACYKKDNTLLYKLEFDAALTKEYGLPYAWVKTDGENYELTWHGKKASRLPQAFWFKFKGYDEDWKISKMGQWIDPEKIIGSPLIMACDKGVKNNRVQIDTLDAALVAPFGRRLVDFEKFPHGQDLYFNLYNNIWNTNFPMWYSDDTRFRFTKRSFA